MYHEIVNTFDSQGHSWGIYFNSACEMEQVGGNGGTIIVRGRAKRKSICDKVITPSML